MKKSILYIIIVVLVIGIVSGVTYLVLDSKKEENKTVENNPESKSDNQTDEKESTTISESELEEYLNYVPNVNLDESVYTLSKSTVDTVNKDWLLAFVLTKAYECVENGNCPFDMSEERQVKNWPEKYSEYQGMPITTYFPESYVKELLAKMYQVDDMVFEEGKEYHSRDMALLYEDGYFLSLFGGGSLNIIHLIENYEVEEELIIYEYAGYNISGNTITDFYNGYSAKSIESNKDSFTKYKNTFKKSSTGYYWYSTEVVE